MAVVMPCLNESQRIDAAISRLLDADWVDHLIVVDGGSVDGSVAKLEVWQKRQEQNPRLDPRLNLIPREKAVKPGLKLRVLHTEPGRGQQLRAGAEVAMAAGAQVLLFVHVDCVLPDDAGVAIAAAMADVDTVGGAFRLRTVADAAGSAPWWLPFADIRARYTRLPYGDQALFVRAEAYVAVGGFPAQALMEDLELARRLRSTGNMARLRQEVRVSGRRFLAKPLTSFVVMNSFPLLYRLGVSPSRLMRIYGHVR